MKNTSEMITALFEQRGWMGGGSDPELQMFTQAISNLNETLKVLCLLIVQGNEVPS